MTTTYLNTRRPVLMKWLMWGCIACAVVCLTVIIILPDQLEKHAYSWLMSCGLYLSPYMVWYIKHYKLQTITIDEENGILINSHCKDNPLKISDITIVKYKRSFRGRYRCLYIHDDSVRFFDIFAPMRTAVRLRHHLKKLNPDINE